MEEMLKRLVARREAAAKDREKLLAQRKAIVDLAESEARDDLNDDEDTEFRSLTDKIKSADEDLSEFDKRITELSEELQRSKSIDESAKRVRDAVRNVEVLNEARTYEKGNGKSYFADLVRSQVQGDESALTRLRRHAEEVRTDKEFRTTLNRTDGQGGYFVPPLWMVQEYVALARAGRATANLVQNLDLPAGTDSLNIPKVATGGTTAIQTADNAAISNTDMTDTTVTAPVRTIAGEQDVPLQLLDQSPVNFDQVIFGDLIADYASKLDQQVISGTNMNGQVKGIRSAGSIETITYTDATPSVAELYGVLADAVQRVHSLRFMPPTVIVMHPRRWGWFLAALDTTDRPLIVPQAYGPNNAAGLLTDVASEQAVGSLHGLPVVTDPNIPTTVNDDEDVILVLRASDLLLWESPIRTRVVTSASGTAAATSLGARTLTSTLQVYGYLAFTAERYPKSVGLITGSGLTTPSFSAVAESSSS